MAAEGARAGRSGDLVLRAALGARFLLRECRFGRLELFRKPLDAGDVGLPVACERLLQLTYLRDHGHPRFGQGFAPQTLGVARRILENAGQHVELFAAVGQRILGATKFGGYASQVVIPVDSAFALPDRLSFEQGAAIPVNYATAWAGLVR